MKLFTIVLILTMIYFGGDIANAKYLHYEKWYQERSCNGEIEHRLPDGKRIDCLTDTYAIEHDFAKKAYECVGQALYYASQTNRLPGCILIIEDSVRDCKYINIVLEINRKFNTNIELWTTGKRCANQKQYNHSGSNTDQPNFLFLNGSVL